jgi:hypothetical protein
MSISTFAVQVPNEQALVATMNSYIAQGFLVMSRESGQAILRKPKVFNVVWAVVAFFLCVLPLLIYLIVYAGQRDQVVLIQIVNAQTPAVQLSADGHYWWDGRQWISTAVQIPPGSPISNDGAFWWDNTKWRPMPVRAAIENRSAPGWTPPTF